MDVAIIESGLVVAANAVQVVRNSNYDSRTLRRRDVAESHRCNVLVVAMVVHHTCHGATHMMSRCTCVGGGASRMTRMALHAHT